MKYAFFVFALVFLYTSNSYAQGADKNFKIVLPADCELGEDCWFMNYVDHDSAENSVKDAACNARSFDGHKGTDLALRDMSAARKGVNVISIAEGQVLRLRDGEPDGFKTREEMKEISEQNRDCGNGVIIDHGQGWLSQYCHLKKDSIIVKQGQSIRRGAPIAEIGMSGVTEHPHVHVSLIHDGNIVDPFTGRENTEKCGLDDVKPLWGGDSIKYTPFSAYDGGFDTKEPDFTAIAQGQRGAFPRINSESLIFWTGYFGAKEGDEVTLTILDPDGKVFVDRTITQAKTRARQYYYVGRKSPAAGFKKGTWKGKTTIKRNGTSESETLTRAVDIF